MDEFLEALRNKDLEACDRCLPQAVLNIDVNNPPTEGREQLGEALRLLAGAFASSENDRIRRKWDDIANLLIDQGANVTLAIKLAKNGSETTAINFLWQKFIHLCTRYIEEGETPDALKLLTNDLIQDDTSIENLEYFLTEGGIGKQPSDCQDLQRRCVPYAMCLKWLAKTGKRPTDKEATVNRGYYPSIEQLSVSFGEPQNSSVTSSERRSAGSRRGETEGREASDVILDALQRSEDLRKKAANEHRFRSNFEALSKELEQFAADLVEEGIDDGELKTIMDIEGEGGLVNKDSSIRNNQQHISSMSLLVEATAKGMKSVRYTGNTYIRFKHILKSQLSALQVA